MRQILRRVPLGGGGGGGYAAWHARALGVGGGVRGTCAPLVGGGVRCATGSAAAGPAASSPNAAPGGKPPAGTAPTSAPRGQPTLIGLNGAPIAPASRSANGEVAEIELTMQNAAQILQAPNAILLLVGTPGDAIKKKLARVQAAAGGRLPVVTMSAAKLPQIAQALQIKSEPTILLMARGQVAAALEGDLSPQTVTEFAEQVAKLLGIRVDLAEDVSEQLSGAEELEWSSSEDAETAFTTVLGIVDLPVDAKVRAFAGLSRSILRRRDGRIEEAKAILQDLENGGHVRVSEVKQTMAWMRLEDLRLAGAGAAQAPADVELGALEAAAGEALAGGDNAAAVSATQAWAVALFWAGREGDAVDAALALLRKRRTPEAKQLVLTLVEALGTRHPRSAKAKKSFANAMFA